MVDDSPMVLGVPPYDPTDIAAQARSRSEIEKRDLAVRLRRDENVKWLMGDKRGREIVTWLLELSGLFVDAFDMNGLQLARNAGRQWVGREIHNAVLAVCPELFVTMIQENATDGGVTAATGRVK